MREIKKIKFIPKRECNDLIDLYHQYEPQQYAVAPDANGLGVKQDHVDFGYDTAPDLYERVRAAINDANAAAGWNFVLTDFYQPLRISRYKRGYSHDWHTDYTSKDASKVAFSCLLNDGFEGGQFQALEVKPITMRPGDAVIFPAFHGHRVTRVTKGERYVLLAWYTGPRFI